MKNFENLSTSQEKRPNEKFGRILFNLAFSLAIIGGFILILVILIITMINRNDNNTILSIRFIMQMIHINTDD